jgi:chromosomal replication initiator protein
MAILRKKDETEAYHIDNEIIQYIAVHVKSNIRELEGALTRIAAFSRLQNKAITLDVAAELLKDQVSPADMRDITPELVIKRVAEQFDLSVEDLMSSKRNRDIANARQIAMYLCKEMTNESLQAIGQALGKRDHATIIHGCEKVKSKLSTDEALQKNIEILKKKINPLI